MPKVEISQQKIIIALETRSPKSLTEIYKILGGTGKLSGSVAHRMREAVPGIEKVLAQNKAAGTLKAEVPEIQLKSKPVQKAVTKPAKASARTNIQRHSKNPFREGSGYGLLVDIIASSGSKGIGKDDLLKAYCKATGKDLQHAKYDLSVINSGVPGRTPHRSMKDSVTVLRDVDNYRVRFV